jgi:hypothetical protein
VSALRTVSGENYFGPRREGIKREWRKVHIAELNDL